MGRTFQSTPPRRRRQRKSVSVTGCGIFNPRLREGGDVPTKCYRRVILFSIHASAKEATTFPGAKVPGKFFSIHASAKEATTAGLESQLSKYFSIHASAKEATGRYRFKYVDEMVFNPRLREGGDPNAKCILITNSFSIHASAKEATATYCNTPAIMCISSLNNFFVHHF